MKKILFCILIALSTQLFAFNFISPLPGGYDIASSFGWRKSVMGGMTDGLHRGIDMVPYLIEKNVDADVNVVSIEKGTAVVVFLPPGAVSKVDGKEVMSDGDPLFGGLVIIYHGQGVYSLYGHMKTVFVKAGQRIRRGEKIGLVGTTGKSTGPHLHFEVDLDPETLLKNDIINLGMTPKCFILPENITK